MPPLSIGFSTMATASLAYSSGRPMRLGKAASLVRLCGELVGDALGEAGAEQARGDGDDADAEAAEVAGHGERHAGDAGLGRGVGDLADLALEGRDRRGVDDDAALVVLGLVRRSCASAWSRLRLNVAIRLRSMTCRNSSSGCGPVLGEGALADAATGGVDARCAARRAPRPPRRAPARCRPRSR